ncbi:NADH-quinone oxidoreductase subunit L [Actimicrobium sp. CCC2.4]|uniref:NADH-quinone oxidoreductase subunit L n=1 Tax=Actimicrobium sp. CCC2.4 TaxID=3048606 RepID=UPI002AC8DE69|nr:NADH-quinone oxidoreductase subunit L [Actimicrobium sp. CCC2.4]MEB0135278.1 NADH-quinone oxidoreductase subunit L [Actimicrobium sp. CCC2.4]WPX31070.1 NADH-quinone oxidoreductase subunit L [Actimicrobium sp. CCC2.4]
MKHLLFTIGALMPAMLMLTGMLLSLLPALSVGRLWRVFMGLSGVALACALVSAVAGQRFPEFHPWFQASTFGFVMALLVQLLCSIIAAFSARYLEGEAGQRRFVTGLAGVMTAVHLLLMADHWVILIAAWALVGVALQQLLCFYPDRPFALLAAHKKHIADRIADVLLISAAALAWSSVGSGSLSALWVHLALHGMSITLQLSAICLVLAVILRTALLPVHGWLIQVMEAPTPVSALLHAGVVNLGGFVLIRFAPLLEQAMPARTLLMVFGLVSAVLAGLVMLTRISIKVRLAWSTTAQMGFMVLECGLGLYSLAALHLIGHSLYKAHSFLSASTVVRQTRLQAMHGAESPIPLSLLLAPAMAVPTVLLIQSSFGNGAWPWWWSVILGLAWAPLLWLPAQRSSVRAICLHASAGVLMVAGLTGATLLAHAVPLGIRDTPNHLLGVIALIGMAELYLSLVVLQLRPHTLRGWRRWSYAGFYLDEITTRLALQYWPASWIPLALKHNRMRVPSLPADDGKR